MAERASVLDLNIFMAPDFTGTDHEIKHNHNSFRDLWRVCFGPIPVCEAPCQHQDGTQMTSCSSGKSLLRIKLGSADGTHLRCLVTQRPWRDPSLEIPPQKNALLRASAV